MAILTHGSDTSLAPTLAPVVRQTDGTVRNAVERLVTAGFGAVQLDATLAGVRPRELDRRARQDLLALLARRGVTAAGIDLFIPRRDFIDQTRIDRAMAATFAAVEYAADLGRLPLSVALPVEDLSDEIRAALVEAADGHGVRLAVHAEDQPDALRDWIETVADPVLGMGLDPAALLTAKDDPVAKAMTHGGHLTVGRLSDAGTDAVRCAVGRGELDVDAYRVSLDLAKGRTGPVVLDLRGLTDALGDARQSKAAWEDAGFSV